MTLAELGRKYGKRADDELLDRPFGSEASARALAIARAYADEVLALFGITLEPFVVMSYATLAVTVSARAEPGSIDEAMWIALCQREGLPYDEPAKPKRTRKKAA